MLSKHDHVNSVTRADEASRQAYKRQDAKPNRNPDSQSSQYRRGLTILNPCASHPPSSAARASWRQADGSYRILGTQPAPPNAKLVTTTLDDSYLTIVSSE